VEIIYVIAVLYADISDIVTCMKAMTDIIQITPSRDIHIPHQIVAVIESIIHTSHLTTNNSSKCGNIQHKISTVVKHATHIHTHIANYPGEIVDSNTIPRIHCDEVVQIRTLVEHRICIRTSHWLGKRKSSTCHIEAVVKHVTGIKESRLVDVPHAHNFQFLTTREHVMSIT
jgi:hypothetical protein